MRTVFQFYGNSRHYLQIHKNCREQSNKRYHVKEKREGLAVTKFNIITGKENSKAITLKYEGNNLSIYINKLVFLNIRKMFILK